MHAWSAEMVGALGLSHVLGLPGDELMSEPDKCFPIFLLYKTPNAVQRSSRPNELLAPVSDVADDLTRHTVVDVNKR